MSIAKNWFYQQKIKLYTPDWSSSKILIIDKEKFIVLPTTITYSSKEKINSTLLINVSTVHITGYIAEFINSVPPTDEPGLIRTYKAMMNRNPVGLAGTFEGNALLFTLDHDFIDGWHIFKRELVGRINENPKTLKDRLKMTIDHDATECYRYYWVERDPYTGEVLDSAYLYTMCYTAGGGSDGGTGGSGTGSANNPPNKEIIDSVKNPCIKAQLANALSAKTTIRNMLNETFGGTIQFESLNLTFTDVTTLPDNISGDAGRASATSIYFDIRLNANKLPGYSQEYILSTIYHEILHAYMFSKLTMGSDGKYNISTQHEDMANKYLVLMTGALKIAFPNISSQDAWALSWGGLEGTNLYASKLTQVQRDAINEVNGKYTNKSTSPKQGTYCN
ncbi:hypothetical protein [Pedobacter sp. R-06]|uniref:hypothetical protein n=1 Tax=Pedobacter sp. R-06 TaxID=3404051 RepID=UPI003CFA466B